MLNGWFTLFYGPTKLLSMPNSIEIVALAMFFGGITSAHTIIPTLPEILEAGNEELQYPVEVLNDFSAGLFNMSFAFGEIFGPLVGNYLFVTKGMYATCDIIGFSVMAFAVVYFIVCDVSMPWSKKQKTRFINTDEILEHSIEFDRLTL